MCQSYKESSNSMLMNIFEFTYDFHINKYGLIKVAERKLKEFLVACITYKANIPKIELFSRFLGIANVSYSIDDLHFFFMIINYFSKYNNSVLQKLDSTLSKDLLALKKKISSQMKKVKEYYSIFFLIS